MRSIVWLLVLALALSAPAAAAITLDLGAARVESDVLPAIPAVKASALDLPLVGDTAKGFVGSAIPAAGILPFAPPEVIAEAVAPAAPPVATEIPVTAAAAATTIGVFGFLHLLAALYSRFAPNELLEHERRERVIGLVRARPGIGPTDIGAALGASWGVTIYHLDRLEKAGLVTSQRVGHHRCYFLPGALPRDDQRKVGMFRVDTTRRVATLVAEKPGLTQTQIANALGLSASAMSKQVKHLEAAGMLRRESVGSALGLFPQPALASVLA